MRLLRYHLDGSGARLGLAAGADVYDLTELLPEEAGTLRALLSRTEPVERTIARLERVVAEAKPAFRLEGLLDSGSQRVGEREVRLLAPIDEQEVWAAGVTYKRSEEARKAESQGAAAFYAKVYEADRPELFFKATPHRTVGGYDAVGIRRDARWNVPEPEFGLVLTRSLEVLGYTIGNDMSSRDIEGENPLYLPQAKVYERSCALGPAIVLRTAVANPAALAIRMRILRGGRIAYAGETSTANMHRTFADLVGYLGRANAFPNGAVLLTGTGIVPDESFTLAEGDLVEIEIEGLGRLVNPVVQVG